MSDLVEVVRSIIDGIERGNPQLLLQTLSDRNLSPARARGARPVNAVRVVPLDATAVSDRPPTYPF